MNSIRHCLLLILICAMSVVMALSAWATYKAAQEEDRFARKRRQ
jgi:cytochrome bd-type quinol oxidase subunit 1